MLRWRIYYADGSTFDSTEGGAEKAPALGVVSIVMLRDNSQGQWYGGDQYGLTQYLIEPGWKRVLLGRTLPDDEFVEISGRAANDPDFPSDRYNLNRKDLYWWEGPTDR